MVQFRESPVNAPEAHALLAEYFADRADIFPGGGYRTVFPDPAAFQPERGVFLLVDASTSDGAGGIGPVGCGGIRRIEDGLVGVRYEVKHLYLRAWARGRGWGRLLLAELERRARAWGAAEMVLDTHHTLEAAGSLYARSGYRLIEPYNANANANRWYGRVLRGEGDPPPARPGEPLAGLSSARTAGARDRCASGGSTGGPDAAL